MYTPAVVTKSQNSGSQQDHAYGRNKVILSQGEEQNKDSSNQTW